METSTTLVGVCYGLFLAILSFIPAAIEIYLEYRYNALQTRRTEAGELDEAAKNKAALFGATPPAVPFN
jgi:hypothetical protein